MLRQFIIFTQKEFYHIFRDRWTMMMLLVLPILMLILFGFGITTEIKNARVAIYDPSRDHDSYGIANKLSQSEYFSLYSYIDQHDNIDVIFREGKAGLVIVFGENFSENLVRTGSAKIQLIADGTDPNTASTLVSYASAIIGDYQREQVKSPHKMAVIHSEVKLLYNPSIKGVYSTVPGVIGMVLLLVCAMMTSVSIAREKELGTMEVILVSPMPPLLIILSKVVPYFALSILNLLNVLLLSYFILEVPIQGSLLLLIGVSLIYIFVSLSLGLLISTVVDKQLVALLISAMGLMMPVVMLSGLMFPIENMPVILQGVAQLIPAKWYIAALKNIMIKGLGISSILPEISVLATMGLVIIAVSIKKFKVRLE